MARSLAKKGLYQDAVRFYEPLQRLDDQLDPSCLSELARCYTAVGRNAEGEALHPSLPKFDGDYDDDFSDNDSTAFEDDAVQDDRPARVPALKLVKKPIENGVVHIGKLEELFAQRQSLQRCIQKNQVHLKDQWASITQQLVESFTNEKAFFPDQKQHHFMGYTRKARHLSKRKVHGRNSDVDIQPDIGKSTWSHTCLKSLTGY